MVTIERFEVTTGHGRRRSIVDVKASTPGGPVFVRHHFEPSEEEEEEEKEEEEKEESKQGEGGGGGGGGINRRA